jgi:hypothetical protein
MMDTNMDTVETMPDFVMPPAGLYILNVKSCAVEQADKKDKTKGSRIRITYTVAATIEVANEQPVPDGSLFSEAFTGTEDGIKFFKKSAMNILGVTSFEGASLGDVVNNLAGTEFKAKITIRKSSKDGKVYENVQVRAANPVVAED